MNADLLAMFGGAGLPNVGNRRNEGKTILSFKAGRMTTELQQNGKYLVTGDPKRGEISMIYNSSPASTTSSSNNTAATPTINFEWKDRRSRTKVDDLTFLPSDIRSNNITFAQVNTGREQDRVYLLQYKNTDTRYFYYMQEKEVMDDVENAVLVNQYLSDFKNAATAAGDEEYLATLQSGNATTTQQIDALSSILENLNTTANTASTTVTPVNTASSNTDITTPAATSGQLTLADLQGAMAGLVSTTPTTNLTDVLSPQVLDETGILSNPSIQEKLLALLPPNTTSSSNEAYLRENLLSPQCLESMKTLQNALSGAGNLQDILLNFQLDSSVLTSGNTAGKNPVELFLEAVVNSVNKESDESKNEEKEEDNKMEE